MPRNLSCLSIPHGLPTAAKSPSTPSENWRLASEAIQKALDNAHAAQQAYEDAVYYLDMAVPISSDVPDLRGVDLRGHDVKSIVELANKMAKDEWDEFRKSSEFGVGSPGRSGATVRTQDGV